ncbi:PrgI family protein [Patescibacteria group bacterium]|nr:PrgI family protein [Patescibacteria group bacterium]
MPQSYKIPQNVDLEDKIFGPLTLKQFLLALGAGVITFISYSVFYPVAPLVFWILTIITWGVTVAFIFVKPNDQPFSKYITSFLAFLLKPTRRVWKRIPSLGEIKLHDETSVPKVTRNEPSEDEVRSRLQHLSHVVDTRGWSEVDQADIGGRVTSEPEAKPNLNIFLADEDQPEDILKAEDEARGSDRSSSELDQMLKQGVSKPSLKKTSPTSVSQRPTPNV